MKMTTLDWVVWGLVVAGAVNWGLVGLANVNLVESVLGMGPLTQLVYVLVGASGLYMVWTVLGKKAK